MGGREVSVRDMNERDASSVGPGMRCRDEYDQRALRR